MSRELGGRWDLLSNVRAEDPDYTPHNDDHAVWLRPQAWKYHHDPNCHVAEHEPASEHVSGFEEMIIEHDARAAGLFACLVCHDAERWLPSEEEVNA